MALPQVSAVYMLTNTVNGRRYVGQAKNVRTRWYWHRNAANGAPNSKYSQRTAIAKAMRKHGAEKFTITILEECAQDVIDEREVFWIAQMGTMHPAGYNLTTGGKPARRALDVGAKISAANKGRVKTPEWRAKLSAAHKGKVISAETRAKISALQRGRPQKPEVNEKRRASMLGKNRRPCSPEKRAKISATLKARNAARREAATWQTM